ncbi:hypothetical protein LMG7141_03628 [Ralstonia condita]|jgi:CDGSH-type Zn-finger protein|uniref:Iron-binding zinc finger CDGSH type domain-containing protein n=1 Tax=Ralstonia condita TaxID=3058600 RepID=A0ABM9JN91_9RALS|nr:CDGSH iron-sulfur domain-containing protein [Ralstonia sp. LMG 7141]CAJ0799129.1 hypothetical protein LMG7141_03628 [Ralstonia sp. LMG 7141]
MANDAVVTIRNDGPYHIKGRFRIVTQGGREFPVEEGQAWLCRCGHSQNKPFCDGSHKRAGFDSNLDAPTAEPSPEA